MGIILLVLGILAILLCGFGFIPGVIGLILGIVALVKIGRNKAALGGSGMAIAGIVMGGLSLLMVPITAAIAIPSLLQARTAANEVAAMASLKSAVTAQSMYHMNDYDGDEVLEYAHTYVKLYVGEAGGNALLLIDESLANASRANPPSGVTVPKAGYVYVDLVGEEGGEDYDDGEGNFVTGFGLCAVPAQYGRSGRRTFVVNMEGTVFEKDTGGEAPARYPNVYEEGWTPTH